MLQEIDPFDDPHDKKEDCEGFMGNFVRLMPSVLTVPLIRAILFLRMLAGTR